MESVLGVSMLKETDYKVANLSLADFGRKEITIAEKEMPGIVKSIHSVLPYLTIISTGVTIYLLQ